PTVPLPTMLWSCSASQTRASNSQSVPAISEPLKSRHRQKHRRQAVAHDQIRDREVVVDGNDVGDACRLDWRSLGQASDSPDLVERLSGSLRDIWIGVGHQGLERRQRVVELEDALNARDVLNRSGHGTAYVGIWMAGECPSSSEYPLPIRLEGPEPVQ